VYLLACLLALTANIHRERDAQPFTPQDFMPWVEPQSAQDDAPIEPFDPEAHSKLLMAALFKKVD